jgi:hypothetical protein
MGRLTLRLPETLHRQLEEQAQRERISLNQYLVYALTRQVTMAYTVSPLPPETVQQQREMFDELLRGLGAAPPAEIERELAGREEAPPPDLPPEALARLQQRAQKGSKASNV